MNDHIPDLAELRTMLYEAACAQRTAEQDVLAKQRTRAKPAAQRAAEDTLGFCKQAVRNIQAEIKRAVIEGEA